MTPAERVVRARYPDAECWLTGVVVKEYVVREWGGDNVDSGWSGAGWLAGPTLGTGPTPDAAWADAAARCAPPTGRDE